MDVQICHSIPGRLRAKIASARAFAAIGNALAYRLEQREDVHGADFRPVTGSIIVRYDDGKTKPAELIKHLRAGLTALKRENLTCFEGAPASPSGAPRESRSSGTLKWHLLNAALFSAFMAYAFIRRLLSRPSLPRSAMSITGFAAIAGTVPLLWHTLQDLRREKRVGLFPFLATTCAIAIAVGEAFVAVEILWVLSIGTLLEQFAAERARKGIRKLLEVTPEQAVVLRNGCEVDTSPSDIHVHETVVIHSGMKIPVDGTVLKGEALVDQSRMTGRSEPTLCRMKDPVFAGTPVIQGTIFVRADKLGEDTYLARIRRMVETALSQPTQLEKRADRLAGRLTRLGLLTTLLTFGITWDFSRSLSVMLIMACPCATVLAASTAVAAALASAARRQILVKGGTYLEQMSSIDTICFDKTGTLTTDAPHVAAIIPRVPRQHVHHILQAAASAETHAIHPLAQALTREAGRRNLALLRPTHTDVSLGRGVRAELEKDTVLVGNGPFLEANGVSVAYFNRKAESFQATGQTVVYVAQNGRLQGMIVLDNTPRAGLSSTLQNLRRRGVSALFLLSGDSVPIVHAMARTYGFDNHRGSLLPEDKSTFVAELEAAGHNVMMIGDGVNDALVLSRAKLGVAMGAEGSEIAIEAADIVLLTGDLEDLVFLHDLSDQTLRIVEQNFWIATFTNLLGIVFAISGWMPPVLTGALHVGHSMGILLNSGRILRYQTGKG